MSTPIKNTATDLYFYFVLASDGVTAVTSGTPVGKYTLDNGSQGTMGETFTHKGNGEWHYRTSAAESNGNAGSYVVTLATALPDRTTVYYRDAAPVETSDIPTAVQNRSEMDSNSTQLAAIVADTNELQTDDIPAQFTAIKGGTFDTATDSLEAIRNRGDSAWITGSGGSGLDAAGTRAALGMSSANLDTQLSDIDTDVNTLLSRITSTLFNGMTSLPNWLRTLTRKDTADSTAKSEINNSGGAFDEATDSLEAGAENLALVKVKTDLVTAGSITLVSHQLPSNGLVIVAGDSYEDDNNRPLEWTNPDGSGWPDDLTGATIHFTAIKADESGSVGSVDADKKIIATGSVVKATTPDQEVKCELIKTDTDVLAGIYGYDVEARLSTGEVHTLVTTEASASQIASESRAERNARKMEVLRQFAEE